MDDSAYQALADASRRAVLCELLERQSIELSTVLTDGGTGDDEHRVALYHQHLPMLADAGYVEWNREDGQVRRGERFDDVRALASFHVEQAEPPSITDEYAVLTDAGE